MSDLRLEIDLLHLETELAEQPIQVEYWATEAANAQLEMDRLKDALAVCEADLSLDMRANPAKYGIAKVTEESIKASVAAHALREQAAEAYYKARHAYAICQGAVNALEHRKRALSNLVDLYLGNYFSSPNRKHTRARGIANNDD